MRHSVGLCYDQDKVSLNLLASMLPNSWYAASDRQLIWATVITCIALLLLFAAS